MLIDLPSTQSLPSKLPPQQQFQKKNKMKKVTAISVFHNTRITRSIYKKLLQDNKISIEEPSEQQFQKSQVDEDDEEEDDEDK